MDLFAVLVEGVPSTEPVFVHAANQQTAEEMAQAATGRTPVGAYVVPRHVYTVAPAIQSVVQSVTTT